MNRYDLIVIGAGPAGLSAAIEGAKCGLKTIVFDENAKPGGQLFKQIHKFFGSKEHRAKIRGFRIGQQLLQEASDAGVEVVLNATVVGVYLDKEVTVRIGEEVIHAKGDSIIIATGASENMVNFEGWTLPGVIGAGAAQTMMNLHGVKPGEKILMLGTGNVGLVVSFQLKQAGCDVVALVDALPGVGGYGVHASKLTRLGIPFYLSHTFVKAEGTDHVEGVTIAEIDKDFKFIPGTEKHFDVDTICLAVGLSPMSKLAKMAGCKMVEDGRKGGTVPVCDEYGETSIPGIYVAGDVSGIEEASSAMIEGRIAGIAASAYLGYLTEEEKSEAIASAEAALDSLRQGMFAPGNKGKVFETTDEGCAISKSLLKNGYIADDEIPNYPGIVRTAKVHPVIECSQNIPCNPCQDACPMGCIKIGEKITSLPAVDVQAGCIGCGKCVAVCPGQAIFLVDESYEEGYASVTIPYEFLPLPKAGDKGKALGRNGAVVCDAEVVSVKTTKAFDHTNLLTIKVPEEMAMTARFYIADADAQPGKEIGHEAVG